MNEKLDVELDDGSLGPTTKVGTLYSGRHYPAHERGLFGIFRDTAPDRWGRVLMERREALEARQQGRRPRRLSEWKKVAGTAHRAGYERVGTALAWRRHQPSR